MGLCPTAIIWLKGPLHVYLLKVEDVLLAQLLERLCPRSIVQGVNGTEVEALRSNPENPHEEYLRRALNSEFRVVDN